MAEGEKASKEEPLIKSMKDENYLQTLYRRKFKKNYIQPPSTSKVQKEAKYVA